MLSGRGADSFLFYFIVVLFLCWILCEKVRAKLKGRRMTKVKQYFYRESLEEGIWCYNNICLDEGSSIIYSRAICR